MTIKRIPKRKNQHILGVSMIKKCPKKRWKSYPSTDISENTQNENTEYKDIFSFFERNAGILAAIGLIGTMISFLPSFAEKLNDDVWLGTLSSYQIAFLFLAIIAGITFIFLLFLSIWDRYSESTYRLPFTIILLFFGLFLVSFESFVYFAIQKYLYVNYLILAIYIVIAIFIVCKFRGETKKAKIFGICCVLFFFTLICVNTAIVSYNYLTLVTPDSTNTRIQSDVYYYSPEIPQTYGIGFSPISDKKFHSRDTMLRGQQISDIFFM